MRHDRVRRRLATVLAVLLAASALAVTTSSAAVAAPRPHAAPGDVGDDGEGGSRSLAEQLQAASTGFLEAKDALERSKQRQQELAAKLKEIDAQVGPRQSALDKIIQQSYMTGRLGPISAVVAAGSTGNVVDRAETLQAIAIREDRALRDLQDTKTRQKQAQLAIEVEIRAQQRQLNLMAKRKAQAENALKRANAPTGDSGGSATGTSARASAAPRNSDGSLPRESCSVDDPTTSGCLTPRTLHALREAQKADFTRFVACFPPTEHRRTSAGASL